MSGIQVNDKFYHVTDIDRTKCARVVPMRVLSLGLCRTGTESLTEALRILGYNEAYHGYQAMITNPRDCEMWLAGLRAKYDGVGKPFARKEFDQLLGHCQAACDLPAICFAPELIKAYPEAKVILTVRDTDEWHKSMMQLVTAVDKWYIVYCIAPFITAVNDLCRSRFRWVIPTFHKAGFEMFGENFQTEGHAIYDQHYKMIESLVPPENLLRYHVKEGWKPLCDFLNQPVPSVPMPHVNSKEEMRLRREKGTIFNLKECVCRVVQFTAYVSFALVLWKMTGMGSWITTSMSRGLRLASPF